ncbi:ABC transporter periplasmic histidine-binding protein precursor [Neisseria gonorrhoeae]|uniref:ABC transporter periplasmic histidine-binding protein n=1 Tax=Neisseria gonorrhoeae TaxID=485 RepID=A0A378VUV2_NEIGO|nr:ABC transporter periplasmic histidine-binding protein precursor [Neisseria gonorrhoeae]
MNAMAKAGNFKIEFKHQPWDSLSPALNNGDADVVMSGVTITDDRKQSMDFSDPYLKSPKSSSFRKAKKYLLPKI